MLKPRYTILINTPTQTIPLKGYKTMELARADAKLWAKEGYGNIIIRKEASEIWEVLPVALFVSLLLVGLMVSLG
jgi:hypothetical protein